MELRHLRYFVAVAELGSVSRAAEKLFVAQPPLSTQIKQLEDEIGTPLLIRYPRGVRLTAAGTVFFEEAKAVIAGAERAKRLARHNDDATAGFARIGYVQSAGHTMLPRLIRRLKALRPGCELGVREMVTSQQVQALRDGEIDVGLARPPISANRVVLAAEMSDPFCLAIASDHPLAADCKPIDLRLAAEQSFVSFPRHRGPAFFDLTIGLCTDVGFSPHIQFEASTLYGVLDLVGAGLGVAIVPASSALLSAKGYVLRALDKPSRAASLALAQLRGDPNPMVATLADLAKGVFAELNDDMRRAVAGLA